MATATRRTNPTLETSGFYGVGPATPGDAASYVAVNQTWTANGVFYRPGGDGTSDEADPLDLDRSAGHVVLRIQYITAAAETNTHDTGYGTRLLACAWQSNNPDVANPLTVTITSAGTVTFDGPTGSDSGFLWLLVDNRGRGGISSG